MANYENKNPLYFGESNCGRYITKYHTGTKAAIIEYFSKSSNTKRLKRLDGSMKKANECFLHDSEINLYEHLLQGWGSYVNQYGSQEDVSNIVYEVTQSNLAKAINVSRSTISEAIPQLVECGLIERYGQSGYIIEAELFKKIMINSTEIKSKCRSKRNGKLLSD